MSTSSVRSIFGLLLQSSIAAVLLATSIQLIRSNFSGPDSSPNSEQCSKLRDFASRQQFETLSDFYPFYLCEHTRPKTKLLHFIGTFNALFSFLTVFTHWKSGLNWKLLILAVIQGYAFAWVGHFFVEINKPATFKYPVFSFTSDWIMFKDITLGHFDIWG